MERTIHLLTGALAAYGAVNFLLIALASLKRRGVRYGMWAALLFGLHCAFTFYSYLVADSVYNRDPVLFSRLRLWDTVLLLWLFVCFYGFVSERLTGNRHRLGLWLAAALVGSCLVVTDFYAGILGGAFAARAPQIPTLLLVPVLAALFYRFGYLLKPVLQSLQKRRFDESVYLGAMVFVLTGSVLLITTGELTDTPVLFKLGLMVIILIFPLSDATGINRRNLLLIRRVTRKHERLQTLDANILARAVAGLMEEDKPYLDENLTLKELAGKLNTHPHTLSAFLNDHYRTKFQHFVNRYRVREACRILQAEPGRTVLSAGLLAGFNSKSAFQEAFKRETGLTPGAYRKQKLKPDT